MKDFLEVLERIRQLKQKKQPAVLATILRVAGSTYRRPGARMVVEPDGTITGMVSGGCLENDVVAHCEKVLAEGKPRLLHYDTMAEDEAVWGLGSGCNGKIDVLLEPLPLDAQRFDYLEPLQAVMHQEAAGYLWTVVEVPPESGLEPGLHIWEAPDGSLQYDPVSAEFLDHVVKVREIPPNHRYANHRFPWKEGMVEVLVERMAPPPHLFVFGAGKDAEPVVELAAGLGWRVDVLDHRPAYAKAEHFPGAQQVLKVDYRAYLAEHPLPENSIVLIMTHLYLHDKTILEYLVPRPPAYLGVLGPRRRTEQLLNELSRAGVAFHPELSRRLYSPIGLDIGAESPEEIAFSILSEIIAVLRGREGGKLRNRKGPIHA